MWRWHGRDGGEQRTKSLREKDESRHSKVLVKVRKQKRKAMNGKGALDNRQELKKKRP